MTGVQTCALPISPGGDEGARRLASIASVAYEPVDERFGITKPPAVAVIDEAACIGCTLCIVACPVDAIVGATKRMHTVIAAACTGCELCLPPCPVDCISLGETAAAPLDAPALQARAGRYRQRYAAHVTRETQRDATRAARLAARSLNSEPQT